MRSRIGLVLLPLLVLGCQPETSSKEFRTAEEINAGKDLKTMPRETENFDIEGSFGVKIYPGAKAPKEFKSVLRSVDKDGDRFDMRLQADASVAEIVKFYEGQLMSPEHSRVETEDITATDPESTKHFETVVKGKNKIGGKVVIVIDERKQKDGKIEFGLSAMTGKFAKDPDPIPDLKKDTMSTGNGAMGGGSGLGTTPPPTGTTAEPGSGTVPDPNLNGKIGG